ncbi:DUF4232 domain-containing protein [Streptomyces sp. NPDC056361]|uniref:DUF4232 domain-containing protein n=1 Tax=Streptomyces sp. NPDC056361 TaxID=3345795 RepID=UPI0035E1B6B2
MRTTRKSLKTCAAGAAAIAALLSTAACGPDDGAAGAKTPPSAGASANPTTADPTTASPSSTPTGATASATPSSGGGGSQGAGNGSGKSGGSDASGGGGAGDVGGDGVPGTPCTDDTFTITASTSPHDSLQHVLLTATNTGDKACVLGGYPAVVFEDATHEATVMKSQLEEFLVQPGKKAYAGVRLFRVGAPTTAVKRMGVSLSPEGYEQNVPLPGGVGFVNIDDDPEVTYWTGSEALAVKQSLAE